MTILSKNDQKGRSMVEMLGVLAIIGVLSVGGISGYSKAMGKFKLTKAQDQISMLLMNIRTAFATSSSYKGLHNGTAINFGIAPSDMTRTSKYTSSILTSTANLVHAFGGAARVGTCADSKVNMGCNRGLLADSGMANDQFFIIRFEDLTSENCFALAGVDWGAEGFAGINVNDVEGEEDGGEGEGETVGLYNPTNYPISMFQLSKACKGGTGNSVSWTFY